MLSNIIIRLGLISFLYEFNIFIKISTKITYISESIDSLVTS